MNATVSMETRKNCQSISIYRFFGLACIKIHSSIRKTISSVDKFFAMKLFLILIFASFYSGLRAYRPDPTEVENATLVLGEFFRVLEPYGFASEGAELIRFISGNNCDCPITNHAVPRFAGISEMRSAPGKNDVKRSELETLTAAIQQLIALQSHTNAAEANAAAAQPNYARFTPVLAHHPGYDVNITHSVVK